MTPEQKELLKQSGRANWKKAAKSTISWALIFTAVAAWTISMQLVGYAQHRDRMDMYARCLDQQLQLAAELPALVVISGVHAMTGWAAFWIAVAVYIASEAFLCYHGVDTLLWKFKTPAEQAIQQKLGGLQ